MHTLVPLVSKFQSIRQDSRSFACFLTSSSHKLSHKDPLVLINEVLVITRNKTLVFQLFFLDFIGNSIFFDFCSFLVLGVLDYVGQGE